MAEWHLKNHELKRYPHFDAVISASAAVKYATDPSAVAKHTFFPFIRFKQRWTSFAEKGKFGKPKDRQLRYAARRDAYIFAYYRSILTEAYEAELEKHNLGENVLAYRRILEAGGKGGKCNIHFAKDAFVEICKIGDCCAIALDISKFFECLDHELLRKLWCRLLHLPRLPPDHFAVFKAITQYSIVDKEKAYERLGHFGPKRKTQTGKILSGYLTPFDKVPKQLCSGMEFRDKIAGGNGSKSIIEKHYKPHGIPQGAPISDLLANLYLLDFDIAVSAKVNLAGGRYYRYSDDIFIITSGDKDAAMNIEADVRHLISQFGTKLEIKEEKSAIVAYSQGGDGQTCKVILGGATYNQGIEYLGFRYNGKNAYIRNKTIQNLYRKMTRAARRDANSIAKVFDWAARSAVYKPLRRACRLAGVEYLPPHQQGRHTYATWLRTYAGLDLVGLKEAGGWESLSSVERYAHVVPNEAAKAADRLPPVQKPSTPLASRKKRRKNNR